MASTIIIDNDVSNQPNSLNVSTFMGIAIHNWSTAGGEGHEGSGADGTQGDLAAAVRQAAGGILGTSALASDLVS